PVMSAVPKCLVVFMAGSKVCGCTYVHTHTLEHAMNTNKHLGNALITGASSGIGAVYADRLARRGYDLILVARNQDRLQQLATRLHEQTGRSVKTVAADLTDAGDLAKVEALLRDDASISMLVNNAGVGATAPLLQADIGKMAEMLNLKLTVMPVPS